jgi:hypothetical protein
MKTCLLCGHTSRDVTVGLVKWVEPLGREKFSAIPRCRNRRACRARLEEIGDEYPVWDAIDSVGNLVEKPS